MQCAKCGLLMEQQHWSYAIPNKHVIPTDLKAPRKVASAAKNAVNAMSKAARFLTSPVKVVVEKVAISQIEKLIGNASKSAEWAELRVELTGNIKKCNQMAAKFKNKKNETEFLPEFLEFGRGVDEFVAKCKEKLKLNEKTVDGIEEWIGAIMFVNIRTLAQKYPEVFQRMVH